MNISRVESENPYIYNRQAVSQSTDLFTVGTQNEIVDVGDNEDGKVPDKYAGMSFAELMNCSELKKNQIPVVNQIVSARNPEDGKIYRVFFTDREIICNHAEGRRAWQIELKDVQQTAKVKDFFEKYEADNKWFKEYYSGSNMEMATVESFWLDMFSNR